MLFGQFGIVYMKGGKMLVSFGVGAHIFLKSGLLYDLDVGTGFRDILYNTGFTNYPKILSRC